MREYFDTGKTIFMFIGLLIFFFVMGFATCKIYAQDQEKVCVLKLNKIKNKSTGAVYFQFDDTPYDEKCLELHVAVGKVIYTTGTPSATLLKTELTK